MPEFNPGLIPTRSRLPAILIAAGILVVAGIAVFFLNPRKTAELSITRTQIYATHIVTQATPGAGNIIGAAPHVDNDLYIVLNVKLTNKLRLPIFIESESGIMTAPDHSVAQADVIQKRELANLYTMFPALVPLSSPPLARDAEVKPGETAEGMVLLHIPGATEDDWRKRESATLTIGLFHQPEQTLTIPKQ